MKTNNTENNTISLRLTSYDKEILQRASEIAHLPLSSYILSTSLKQAQIDILNEDKITLTNKDRDLVISILSNPPEPNQALEGLVK